MEGSFQTQVGYLKLWIATGYVIYCHNLYVNTYIQHIKNTYLTYLYSIRHSEGLRTITLVKLQL